MVRRGDLAAALCVCDGLASLAPEVGRRAAPYHASAVAPAHAALLPDLPHPCLLGPPPLPARRFTEGIYVLYTYTANPAAGQAVQKYLSTPQAGAELNILRHMTFRL